MSRGATVGAVIALVLTLLAGCGSAEPVALPPPSDLASFYTLYGFPGPWSREGASHADFDRDTQACRDRSSAARRDAEAGTRSDAAYRAFLACMQELRWTRGAVPRKETSRADAALEDSATP